MILCVIQARLGSSRLPGKCLRTLHGVPLIGHVVQRATTITRVDKVILATSTADRDQALAAYVSTLGLDVIRGSETDVLERYVDIAHAYGATTIMRVTGDCPFLAPEVAEATLVAYMETNPLGAEYMSNDTTQSGYPDGTDVEVFSRALLDVAHEKARTREDREHVTPWMRRTATTGMIRAEHDWSQHKLSVDTEDDYLFASAIAQRLPVSGDRDHRFGLATTLAAVEAVLQGGSHAEL